MGSGGRAPHDPGRAMRTCEVQPEAVVHLAVASSGTGVENEGRVVSVDWSERYAVLRACGECVRVHEHGDGLHRRRQGAVHDREGAGRDGGYGGEKAEAERRVLEANRTPWSRGSAGRSASSRGRTT